MNLYNSGEMKYENTPLDDAFEILDKAYSANTKSKALKLAKKAYEKSNDCFDAILFQVELEDDPIKAQNLLNNGLNNEKKRLEKEGFFKENNIGHFYGIYETRPFIKGLSYKADMLVDNKKIDEAVRTLEEIIRLNDNDNTGARTKLLSLYAYLKDEEKLLNLYNKYKKDKSLGMYLPPFYYYLFKGDEQNAKKYLKLANKSNKNYIKLFKGTIKEKEDSNIFDGTYSPGKVSEVLNFMFENRVFEKDFDKISEFVLKVFK